MALNILNNYKIEHFTIILVELLYVIVLLHIMILTYDCCHHIFKLLNGDIISQLKIKSLCKELNSLQIIDLLYLSKIQNKIK